MTNSVRVLIVEDDSAMRESLADLLRGFGHDVVAALDNGDEAIERARALQPDAILMDVHLPGRDGIAVAEALAEALPGVGVVFISGDEALQLTDAQATSTSAVAFLPKPTPPRMLDSTVRLAAARAHAYQAARREATDAKAALEARKVIERAKGVLMRRTGCSEPEAYRILQRSSQDRSLPMVEIAKAVLESEPTT